MANILIAEDEDVLRRNLAFIFNSFGHTAYPARNTVDAIEILKRGIIDVAITDMVMPEKGGTELIQYITENHNDIAIIIMTAYPSVDTAINAVKKGVVDYFTKPFQTEDVLTAVENALERKKGIPFQWSKLKPMGLTSREEDILKLLLEQGMSESKELAKSLSIKPTTVKQHLDNLYGKFNVNNRTALVAAVINLLRK